MLDPSSALQILECQGHGQLRSNDLNVPTFYDREGRAQDFVAPHDLVDAPLQDRRVARRGQAQRKDDIEKRQVRHRRQQLGYPFLRDGSRRHSVFARHAANSRSGSGRLASRAQCLDVVSHLRDGGRLEEERELDLDMHDVVQLNEDACGQQRVPAQRKEIIVGTDLFDLQHLSPDSGEHLLDRRAWRDVGLRRAGVVLEPQLRGQADTLHFAGRAFRDFLDDEHLARDLEVGDAPEGKLTNVFRRRRSVRAATRSPTRRPRPAWRGGRQRSRLLPPPDGPGALRRLPGGQPSRRRD